MAKYIKKTIELDMEAIRKLKKIFDVSTDKEAVNQAMQLIATEDDIIKTHIELGGNLDLENPFK